jgi:hypothetical protein
LFRDRPSARAVIALLALLGGFFSTSAHAHGGATIDKDPCVQKTGNWSVHFTVYEPEIDPSGEYCADVPKAGSMIVVFDLVDQELRHVPFGLEVVKVNGSQRETVHQVPAKPYPKGVINAQLTIASPGRYAAIVTPEGRDPIVFPMRVEIATPLWVWVIPLVFVAPLLYYWSQRRTPPSAAASETRRNLALVK